MLTFPTHLFNPLSVTMRPVSAVITGGESLAGETDVISTDGGGFWQVAMTGVELIGPDQIRAWRAWEDTLEGGVEKVLVPVADIRQAPLPIVGGRRARPVNLAAGSDDPYFPEAVGFPAPIIVARIVGAAALRATTVTLEVLRGSRLRGGEIFAVTHPTKGRRCYRVRRVLSRDGQRATVSIRMPLREAVTANTPVDFDWPSLVATLDPNADISPAIENGHSSVGITFREAF